MNAANASESTSKKQSKIERKSDRELVVTRVFDAPAKLVFDCWTKPELMKRWWAPREFGVSMKSVDVDLRVGGKYKLVFATGDGKEMEFFGVYKEVQAPNKLVSTDDEQGGGGGVTTTTFTETNGKTTVVIHQLFGTKEELDEGMTSGMLEGTQVQHGQLEELLPELL